MHVNVSMILMLLLSTVSPTQILTICKDNDCSLSTAELHVPCMLDDSICLGLSSSEMPQEGVVNPLAAISSPQFHRVRAHRHFQQAMQWLFEHQHPCNCSEVAIFALEHPKSDGDGFATRLARLVTRIVPHLLEGAVFVIDGGFRGYTDTDHCDSLGLECIYQPVTSCQINGKQRRDPACNPNWSRSSRKPRKHLLQHSPAWWFGILLYFIQRPSANLSKFIQENVQPLPNAPLLRPQFGMERSGTDISTCYISLHIRKGDKNEARPFIDDDYIVRAKQMASLFLKFVMASRYTDTTRKVLVYVATDDKNTAKHILEQQAIGVEGLRFVMINTTETRGIGRPGQSVANYLLRKATTQEKQYRMTLEIAADTLLLSNACGLVGLASSKVTLVAAAAATASGRLLMQPVAVDADREYSIHPAKSSSRAEIQSVLWNIPLAPFLSFPNPYDKKASL
eukprot:gene9037-1363_t